MTSLVWWPYRLDRVMPGLSNEWRAFDQIVTPRSALDAKQLTGVLVALRNRGVVASRVVHTPQHQTLWRLKTIVSEGDAP